MNTAHAAITESRRQDRTVRLQEADLTTHEWFCAECEQYSDIDGESVYEGADWTVIVAGSL